MSVIEHSVVLAAALVVGVGALGCSGESDNGCEHEFGGVCYGAPAEPVCDGAYCSSGSVCGAPLACQSVVQANSDASVASALASASPGDCVAVAAGNYQAVVVPSGVSLLGKGAKEVAFAGVTVSAGSGSVLRGAKVGAGGILLQASSAACIDSVEVVGSAGSGVDVGAGASAMMRQSTIVNSGSYGVKAFDSAAVSVEKSVVKGSGGPGLRAQCGGGCGCTAKPAVMVSTTLFASNKQAGVVLSAVDATVSDVAIVDSDPLNGKFGAGMSVDSCSAIAAEALLVRVRKELPYGGAFGVLVDSSTGTIGSSQADRGIIVIDGRPGVWLKDSAGLGPAASGLTLQGLDVRTSAGVGLGIDVGAMGIIVIDGKVEDTSEIAALGESGGSKQIGYGVAWSQQAQVSLTGTKLSGNALQSVLVDGVAGAGSVISGLQLSGSDATTAILQQGVPSNDASIDANNAGASITKTPTLVWPVPPAPTSPGGI